MIAPAHLTLSVLALALLAAFGPARADPVVEGSASIGAGLVSGDREDRSAYDQYNGLKPGNNAVILFGADYYRRDDDKGTSVQFQAGDLGTGNRELGLRWKKQGDWKAAAEYRELTRNETAFASPEQDFRVKRTALGLDFSKVLGERWQLDGSLRSEKKDGSRLWGTGFNCPSPFAPGCRGTTGTEVGYALLFTPEPIRANHSQMEARVSYAGDKLRLSGGYYGSFYRNDIGSVTPVVPGVLFNAVGTPLPLSTGLGAILAQPVALPPDNQAHHVDLTGSYSFTRTTLLNFKLAYSLATQQQNFAASGFTDAPLGVSDLGGKVATTLAQVGFTSRPSPKLAVSGNLRYEHKDDSTPLALYNIEGTSTYTNRRLPRTDVRAKAQAAYQITSDWRATVGAGFEAIERGVFTPTSAVAGITALRRKTEETSVRAELRRRMSEEFSGAVSVESSRRDGSHWLADNSGPGVTEVPDPTAASSGFSTGIFMPTLADRRRDKVRVHGDWQPNEKLALQVAAETGRDRFSSPSVYGLREAAMNSVSMDASYTVNDKWSVNGFVSHGRQALDQARPQAAVMAFDNTATTLGIGFAGKPKANLDVGGSLSFIDDRSAYAQTLDPTAGAGSAELLAATGGLPDTLFRQTTLKLFARYAIDKQSSVRVDLAHQRTRWTDWAWGYQGTPFVYSDGTTIVRRPTQSATFIGVMYTRKWP